MILWLFWGKGSPNLPYLYPLPYPTLSHNSEKKVWIYKLTFARKDFIMLDLFLAIASLYYAILRIKVRTDPSQKLVLRSDYAFFVLSIMTLTVRLCYFDS